MRLKKLIGVIHLWLGLASGIVIVIIALTGAIWAFETEIQNAVYSYRKVTPPEQATYLPPSVLKKNTQVIFGTRPINMVQYIGKDRPALVRSFGEENGKEYNITAFINPYTGVVQHVKKNHNFFDIVIELHTSLMLGKIGKTIIDVSTLIFLVMVISGIILWWPSNKNRIKTSFRIKWNANFKRKNYDLHNVFGFYASWVLIFIVITGLAWGFTTVDKAIYAVATGNKPFKDFQDPASTSDTLSIAANNAEDICFNKAIASYSQPFVSAEIYYPSSNTGNILISLNPSTKSYYKTHTYFYDQRTTAPLSEESFASSNAGEKVRSMYYDIHIGKVLGLPGQFLVFFASLIAASLPITGFLIWRGKHNKK
jgi:uncharacterized iron-regulated membrane protein